MASFSQSRPTILPTKSCAPKLRGSTGRKTCEGFPPRHLLTFDPLQAYDVRRGAALSLCTQSDEWGQQLSRYRKGLSTFGALLLYASLVGVFALPMAQKTHADETPIIVGFPEDNMANDWRAAQMRQLADELAKYPEVKFLQADAGGQVARNLQDIEAMVGAGAKLLFLGPRNAKLMTPVVEDLRRQGIHIVLLTRRIESEDFDTYISPSDANIARAAAVHLAKYLGGKGRVLMLEGVPTATTAIQRSAGFKDGLAQFPDMELVSTISGSYSRVGGIAAIENALKDSVEFDAIFSHNDAMLIGARLALRAAGINPADRPSVGIDYIRAARDAIRSGEQLASFTYPTCGKEGAWAAMEILKGNTVPKYIEVPAQIVTQDNVESVPTVF